MDKTGNMPNTDHFQKNPDFFSSKQEGKSCERVNTNPRYKFFKQTHFTAGDYEQFLEHWDRSSHHKTILFEPLPFLIDCSSLYKDISSDDVIHTFEYILHKYKKGIFFKIIQNELRVFLPFSKIEYTNEWSDLVRVDPKKHKNIFDLIGKSCVQSGHPFDPNRIHYKKDHWYANNGLLRYEFPISENDSGVSAIRDMLLSLCRERSVPDGEYFINKRDFPILKKDKTEAYECIFGDNTPLLSHSYDKYCPILGMTTTDDHADVPIPTWDDWGRVEFSSGKVFAKDYLEYPDPFVPNYSTKKDTAIFRGASTGLGTTLEDNPRLYFTFLSQQNKCDEDGVLFLDCAITKWNCRPRKTKSTLYYDTIDKDIVERLGVGDFMTMKQQAEYKFILHLPGHSEAYRLSMELATGSVILYYPCRYKLWYSSFLREYVHYVPIDPKNPLDIYDKIRWCKQNPVQCEEIASNARKFYEENLSRNGILDYLQNLLGNLQHITGKLSFPQKNMFDFQLDIEKEALGVEQKIIHNQRLFPFQLDELYMEKDLSHLHPRSFQVFLHRIDPHYISRLIEETPLWKQSRNVMIKKITIANRVLCVKTPFQVVEKNIHHECFIGQVGMNKLANVCPMVLFQYGRWGDSIITDFIEGETLETFLHHQDSHTICKTLKMILCQLSLFLHYAQAEMGFLHYDLYPWNIIIHKNVENTHFSFPSHSMCQTIDFQPPYYPVLIDFGKSHIVCKNIHFANVSPFHLHLHQDILSILVSSVFLVVQHHKLSSRDAHDVVHLINYISKTKYSGFKKFENITQIKQFLKLKKKYSNMLMMEDKVDFKDMDPLHLFEYIKPSTLFHIHRKTSGLTLSMEIYYSRFMILHELSGVFSNDGMDLYEAFKKDRHIQKNPINMFFHLYVEYHMVSLMFPEKLDRAFLIEKLMEYGKKEWRIKPILPHDKCVLPRFFSHPDITKIEGKRSINHYHERHKVFSIITHALCHIPELAWMRDKLVLHFHYLQPMLMANKDASVANHLSLYKDSLVAS